MSDTIKRPYELMNQMAERLVKKLAPACERIEIAGSLRRRKAMVGDIELVLIPIAYTDLFGAPLPGATQVDSLLATWPIKLVKNGQKYKQFTLEGNSGAEFTVDLFIQPDPATWGVNMMIRTGSSDFSHKMVTAKELGGLRPDEFTVRDARVWCNGAALETPNEEDVFRLWGMDFIKPEERI